MLFFYKIEMDEEETIINDEFCRHTTKKRSLLGIFGKRLSRVEPDPKYLETEVCHLEGELTPVLRHPQKKKLIQNQTTLSIVDNPKTLNRLSGNFTFCCSSAPANAFSPIESKEITIVKPNIRPRSHLKLELQINNFEGCNMLDQNIKVSTVDPSTFSKKNNNNVNSLQKSITESKSRFRNRYLPPSRQLEYKLRKQQCSQESICNFKIREVHLSSPDLCQLTINSAIREENQRNRRYFHA